MGPEGLRNEYLSKNEGAEFTEAWVRLVNWKFIIHIENKIGNVNFL